MLLLQVCACCEVFKLHHIVYIVWLSPSCNLLVPQSLVAPLIQLLLLCMGGWDGKSIFFQGIAYTCISSISYVAAVTAATRASVWTFHKRTFHLLLLQLCVHAAKCLNCTISYTLCGSRMRAICWLRSPWLHHSPHCFNYAWVGGLAFKKRNQDDHAFTYVV